MFYIISDMQSKNTVLKKKIDFFLNKKIVKPIFFLKIKWGILADICNKNISLALLKIFHRIKECKCKSLAYINFLFMKSYFKKKILYRSIK